MAEARRVLRLRTPTRDRPDSVTYVAMCEVVAVSVSSGHLYVEGGGGSYWDATVTADEMHDTLTRWFNYLGSKS